jgi:streptogramin lyase
LTLNGDVTQYDVPFTSAGADIVAGPDEALWFTPAVDLSLGRITTEGAVSAVPVLPGRVCSYCKTRHLTVAPDGSLWLTDPNENAVIRIARDRTVTTFPLATADARPWGIAADRQGNVWFTEADANQIGRVTLSGALQEYALPTSNSMPNTMPKGIAVDDRGNGWFTESKANKIGRISPQGVIDEFKIPTLDSNPQCITFGPDGAMWFTESDGNRIGRITTGQQSTTPSSSGVLPSGQWISPADAQLVGDVVHFAARAYPTRSSDPTIQSVNFNVGSQNSWVMACQAPATVASGDTFSCDAQLSHLNVQVGRMQISFDVYDKAGNVNFAPAGIRTVTYAPPTPDTTLGPALFSDPLTTNSKGWLSDGATTFFRSDGFHFKQLPGTGASFVSAPYSNQGTYHATITVEAKQILGARDVAYVLALGECPDCYEFEVNSGGFWSFSKTIPQGQGYLTVDLAPLTSSSAIRTGLNAINKLQVRANGGHFDLFINGIAVGSINDQSHTLATVQLGFDDPRSLPTSGWVEDVFSNLTVTPN